MKILAIDTAFAACNLAVVDTQNGICHARTEIMARGQAEQLVPLMGTIMAQASLTYADLNLIVTTIGPGSFTGVRVGIATARGLALALDLPVQGVCTLDALQATFIARGGEGAVAAMVDSRRDDVFAVRYAELGDCPVDEKKIAIFTPQAAAAQFADIPWVGDGAVLCGGRAEKDIILPDPAVMARFGGDLYQNGPEERRGRAVPLYARDADVTSPKKMV